MQIERRHLEICEVLRKLLELDAANRAEAAALTRLTEDSATTPSGTSLIVPETSRPEDGSERPAGAGDGPETSRAGVKRRNPFSRAVSAIRKKFARPQQESIPAAA